MSFDVARAASLLVEARQSRRQAEVFSPGPSRPEEAYAVQEAVVRRFGPVGGWKVGAKSPEAEPNTAPLFASLIQPSPAAWPAGSLHMRGVEAEIAFRIGRDLPAGGGALGQQTVLDALESVHAAIEIVDTRIARWREADPLWLLADNQSNGGFVYDPAGIPWTGQDFTDAPVRLTINGRIAVEQRGGNTAGDPRRLLLWLVNHCIEHRGGLKAGAMITTGSYTGMIFVEAGARVEAAFSGIGRAEVTIG
jgi:2-keto-4-pentenoate hydratase